MLSQQKRGDATGDPVSPQAAPASDDADVMFDLAPISLWLEDFSAVKALFDEWRAQGVTALREFLWEDSRRVAACASRIRVLKVNAATLEQFEATSLGHLTANLDKVFQRDMLRTHVEELNHLWEGHTRFASPQTVNYTLTGRRMDVQLRGTVLPGHEATLARVLISTEDVTDRETARRAANTAETYARGLFEHSPVSLWVEDFSSIKRLLDDLRRRGIDDLRVFTDVHPEFVARCISEIRVIEVNRHTLDLFGAPDQKTLISSLGKVFREEMFQHFRSQLVDLWEGKLTHQREVLNYTLAGEQLYLHLQFSVLPGREEDWSLVQVALTDITARKKAEAYLEYLGNHDVLTKLYNRSFYMEEMNRLERRGPFPVSVLMLDLNDLKQLNDQLGHAAGDAMLRRLGEVLGKAVDKPNVAARIGGDEFAVLMPGTGEEEAAAMAATITELIAVNNQFYSAQALSVSLGAATSRAGERLEMVARRADFAMYENKRAAEAAGAAARGA